MPYVNRKIADANGKKAYEILMSLGHDMRTAQRLIDRARMSCNGVIVSEKNAVLNGEITLVEYECEPKGLKPIYEFNEFAIFDKPSGVLSHPNGRHCEYSLNDEIWSLFGREASVAHRLDRETSGLIIVAKNRASQIELKQLFESRAVGKSYLALVCGRVLPDDLSQNFSGVSSQNESKFCVDLPMNIAQNYDDVKMRMKICPKSEGGKSAITKFELVEYFADLDASLLRCYPLTGKQHQIRLHLFHVGHKILGEPLYGLKKEQIIDILDGKMSQDERLNLTGATRLLLHADEIWFKFNEVEYKFKSKFDAKNEFYKLAKFITTKIIR